MLDKINSKKLKEIQRKAADKRSGNNFAKFGK